MFVQKINGEEGRMRFQKHMRPWAPKPWGPRERLWGTRITLRVFPPLHPPHIQSSYHRIQPTHLTDGKTETQRLLRVPVPCPFPIPFDLCAPSKGGLRSDDLTQLPIAANPFQRTFPNPYKGWGSWDKSLTTHSHLWLPRKTVALIPFLWDPRERYPENS